MIDRKRRSITAKKAGRKAFTLVELMLTMSATAVLLLALAIVLAGSHRQWHRMYNHVYSNVVVDAFAARQTFDRIARRSTYRKCVVQRYEDSELPTLSGVGESMLLFYYGDETARQLDCYAWFYWDRDNRVLKVQYGSKQPWYVDKDPADGSPDMDIDGDVIFNPEQWQVPTPDVTARTVTLAHNVIYCHFRQGNSYALSAGETSEGRCVSMFLTLDNGKESIDVACTAERRNR